MELVSMHGEVTGSHWRDLEDLHPLYQAVTAYEVRNGQATSFWADRWLSAGRLKDTHPLLYSHTTKKHVSLACIKEDGLECILERRLSREAAEEYTKLQGILERVALLPGEDRRYSPLAATDGALRAGPIYRALMATTGAPPVQFTKFVWQNRAPPRVQFFAWLLVQNRLQCRSNLVKKQVVDAATCPLCSHPDETCDHLILDCPFAAQVWGKLQIDTSNCRVTNIWNVVRPQSLPLQHFNSFILLISWQLWKHRNSIVFDGATPSHQALWNICKEEARLWAQRLPQAERHIADTWCTLLSIM
ncbi:unnamed protein product [Urochloa humidicola]